MAQGKSNGFLLWVVAWKSCSSNQCAEASNHFSRDISTFSTRIYESSWLSFWVWWWEAAGFQELSRAGALAKVARRTWATLQCWESQDSQDLKRGPCVVSGQVCGLVAWISARPEIRRLSLQKKLLLELLDLTENNNKSPAEQEKEPLANFFEQKHTKTK